MKGTWVGGLIVSLGLVLAGVRAEDPVWRRSAAAPAAPPSVAAVTLLPPVVLGRPVPLESPSAVAASPTYSDRQVTPASYNPAELGQPRPLVRAQAPDPLYSGPTLAPPVGGNEPYNCGVVTTPPPGGVPPVGVAPGVPPPVGVPAAGPEPGARGRFQSDHGFDQMISPLSNPFLFEDPRALTEIRPIFMWQQTPSNTTFFRGGDIEYAGIQARVALTERLDLVISELGWIWDEQHSGLPPGSHSGFAEVRLGPKYTFYRCEDSGTVAAAGLNFDLPVGEKKVFQNTGTLSLEPYLSLGQTFGKSSYGTFNFMGTVGYSFAVDSQRSDFLFTSLHLDFDVASAHKFYPLVEFNWFVYTKNGTASPGVGVEGRDLFNFGSSNVSGNETFSFTVGARYKFTECIQTGIGFEVPVGGHRDLMDFRLMADLIFRY